MRFLYQTLALAAAARAASVSLESLFGPYLSPGTEIAELNDTDFDDVVSPRWSEWRPPSWTGAIKPATEKDLQEIVRIAVANNVSFMATNGGHGTSLIYGTVNGLDINLENFNSVDIDLESNTVTVGAGAKLGDITIPLYEAGKAIPRGNSPCVGVIGATIGGGIGYETGLFGLGVDALTSVRLVTATGALVTANTTHNADLLWAIRGAGANFGIITAATFTMSPQPNNGNAVIGSFVYNSTASLGVFEYLAILDDVLPPELGVQLSVSYNRTTNETLLTVDIKHFAGWDTFVDHFESALALNPISANVTNVTLVQLYDGLDGPCQTGAYISGGTIGLGRTDPATLQEVFDDMTAFYRQYPGYIGQTLFQRYANNNTLKTPAHTAVYPWRDTKMFWLHENIYTDPALEKPTNELLVKLRKKLHATSGFPQDQPHIYVNYAFGDEGAEAWWGEENLPRLSFLKRRWDPKGVFGRGTPIPRF
ncbi:FAD-binding oxidoreductase [Aspergillus mulundensis]|uniref:FAD-linked oxidoreductase afoF n=1 Tax=Aspergillus mulundensis TaxID=1810919 RepID=A0A3D8RRV3_9EURO|nr:FAD-linked oxidoreductase afoF [Aspergillus mulundensis]RDW76676.1 FAD-linked oxidoreductase afoF [Aspergillus mulundensis]